MVQPVAQHEKSSPGEKVIDRTSTIHSKHWQQPKCPSTDKSDVNSAVFTRWNTITATRNQLLLHTSDTDESYTLV